MNVTIKYVLSPAGQKFGLLAGGDGKAEQTLAVERDDPAFPDILEEAKINADGTAILDLTPWHMRLPEDPYGPSGNRPEFDSIPTAAEALTRYRKTLDDIRADIAYREAKQKEESERRRGEDAATLAAWAAKPLSERVTKSSTYGYWTLNMPSLHGSLPDDHPAVIEAKAEYERLKTAADEARARAKQEAAAAEQAHRQALGLEEGDLDLRIEDGALAQVPSGCWESHKRGKNWLATITVNPAKPGGLERDFAAKARGDSYYLLPSWNVGDAVEFGADYYSGAGRKNPTRWYGFVVRVEPKYVVLRVCTTGKAAVKAGEKYAAAKMAESLPQ